MASAGKAPGGQGNIVFVFPHQDDEMFIFHRIRRLQREGRRLFMVWLTDGAANSAEIRNSPSIRLFFPVLAREDDATIRRIRRAESCSLMHRLGVPAQDLRFLGYPSGCIKAAFGPMVEALRGLFAELKPQEIYTVAFDHSEFEHDVCNAAVALAARGLADPAALYEFPVFNNYRRMLRLHWLVPHPGARTERTAFTIGEERERLRLFGRIYRSQRFVAWAEQVNGFLFPGYRRLGEPYRAMPEYDYTRPIPGARVMYVPTSLRFEDFRDLVLQYPRT